MPPPELKHELSEILWEQVPLIGWGGFALLLTALFPGIDPALAGVVSVIVIAGGLVVLAVILVGANPLQHTWIIVKTTIQIIAVSFGILIGALLIGGILSILFPSWQ